MDDQNQQVNSRPDVSSGVIASSGPTSEPPRQRRSRLYFVVGIIVVLVLLSSAAFGYVRYDENKRLAKEAAIARQKANELAKKEAARKAYEASTVIPLEKAITVEAEAQEKENQRLVNRQASIINSEVTLGPNIAQGNENGL